jgi:periplasmic divalent cation tolerance protein
MPATTKIIVLTNCASQKEARRIAKALLERREAACVNILTRPVESRYWWKGKLDTTTECPVAIKTTRARYAAVERTIRELHSYDVPEIIAVPIVAGSRDYLSWIDASIDASNESSAKKGVLRKK